ncbi:deacetoxyvindoline 4-hydroxylase-like [Forsythia ovata]|uniref:Deacetoxyvindoline 4-hydroxylase-like n=1 Tax=Forsythia ovata TaxID=205694 RepID=A0ABD1PJZ9_9LAMI
MAIKFFKPSSYPFLPVQPIVSNCPWKEKNFSRTMTSNDEFKSAEHRVLANRVGPRISVACFFTGVAVPPKIYGPIKELISEENPPLYKKFTVSEYVTKFYSKAIDKSGLEDFKLKG